MSLVTMREILPYAEEKKIAIPAFNIDTMEITQAILETVEEENCPAIIAVGQAAIKDGKLESLAATVRTLAKDMKTPVVLHLDHGQSVEQVVKALCAGFTSVMIDGSKLSFEDNIAVTQEVVRIANAAGASVEAELGAILGSEDNISHDDSKPFLVRVQDVIDLPPRSRWTHWLWVSAMHMACIRAVPIWISSACRRYVTSPMCPLCCTVVPVSLTI